MKFSIINAKIITAEGILPNASITIEEGKILRIYQHGMPADDCPTVDALGNYVSPGFIDLHVHGGAGHDFMDGSVESFLAIAELHLRHGTTAMMPTTLTGSLQSIHAILDSYEEAASLNSQGAEFLGVHLEGPYFAMAQKGAQDPKYIRNPDPSEYKEILDRHACIKRWSVAPELPGALEFGRLLHSQGIIASIAHTDALYDDILPAVKNGYSLVTHLYSAMNGVIRRNAYRYAGTVEAALLLDGLDVEIIADGRHLPPALLQLVYKVKGPDRIALITDAMRAAGTLASQSILGNKKEGLPVVIEDQVAKLPDRSAFAGSIATADRLVRTMWKDAGISLADVIKMMSTTPARIAGCGQTKGSLEPGKDADIVLFNKNVEIRQVYRKGKLLFEEENLSEPKSGHAN